MDSVEQQRAHFERVSDEYLNARQNANHLELKQLLWSQFLSDKREVLSHVTNVLEPMCGYAEGRSILQVHLGHDFSYTGFDFSRPLVDEARMRFPESKIFLADVTQFEPSEQFDLIILIGGLHHVYAHTAGVLKRLYSALKPGGHFINFEPTQNNRLFRLVRDRIYRGNHIFDADTERAFDLNDLNLSYVAAGFEIADQMYPGLVAYIMYYNPDAFPILNVGGTHWVRRIFRAETPFYRAAIASRLSFATLSLLTKPRTSRNRG